MPDELSVGNRHCALWFLRVSKIVKGAKATPVVLFSDTGHSLVAMQTALLILSFTAVSAGAQVQAGVDISVVSPTGEPLRYSTVEVTPGEARFTSDEGRFVFNAPQAGRYQIRVKHLGFAALDTAVTLGAGVRMSMKLTLQPVAIHLAAVKVREKNGCKAARTAGNDLYIALEELRKNAERDRILRNSYPFIYRVARRYGAEGAPFPRQDTVSFQSLTSNSYRPGNIFQIGSTTVGATREVRIPTLSDLADDLFLRNHCFTYGGIEVVGDYATYRIDFTPASGIDNPDFEGSAYVDVQTYMIRKAVFQVTHPERANIAGISLTTTYREIFPGVALVYSVRGVQPTGKTDMIDEQRLVDVRFLGDSPSQTPQPKVIR